MPESVMMRPCRSGTADARASQVSESSNSPSQALKRCAFRSPNTPEYPGKNQGSTGCGDSRFQGIGPITCVAGKGSTAPSKATCYVDLNSNTIKAT
jgi:hypothetical protein